jgi:hypothetical protein
VSTPVDGAAPFVADEQAPPHDLDAERAALGAVMVQNTTLPTAAAILRPSDFYRHVHQCIFGAMLALTERHDAIDFITLRVELTRRGQIDEVGPAYLAALVDGVPQAMNVEHYARIVRDKAVRRRIIGAGRKIAAAAYDGEYEPAAIIETGACDLAVLAETGRADRVLTVLSEQELSSIGAPPWFIDRLSPRGVTVLAVPPGIGKTAVTTAIAVARASGLAFLGHGITETGLAVLVLAEGAAHADARVRAAKKAAGLDPDTPVGISVVPHSVNFFEAGRDWQELRALVRDLQPLVVLDTLGLCSVGADENAATDMTRVFANIRRLDAPSVIVNHHMGAAGTRERGSSAIRANADALLTLLDVDDRLVLSCEKMRDGAAFEPHWLTVFEVPDTGACSVRLASEVVKTGTLSPAQRQVLDALIAAFPSGGSGATRKEVGLLVPTMKERTLYHAIARLLTLGFVTEQGGRLVPTGRSKT